MCLGTGREAKDVGISTRGGARCVCPLPRARGAQGERDVRRDGVAENDGSLVLPEVLRPSPVEGISARLMVPHVGKVLHGVPVGEDVPLASKWFPPRALFGHF